MTYTIYDTTTGRLLRIVSCNNINIQLQENESYVEGYYPDDKFYWDNGIKAIPTAPSEFHYFDYSTKQLVEDVAKKESILANQYKTQRQMAYPSIPDQLDILYHQGFDTWKEIIQQVKEQYPKP